MKIKSFFQALVYNCACSFSCYCVAVMVSKWNQLVSKTTLQPLKKRHNSALKPLEKGVYLPVPPRNGWRVKWHKSAGFEHWLLLIESCVCVRASLSLSERWPSKRPLNYPHKAWSEPVSVWWDYKDPDPENISLLRSLFPLSLLTLACPLIFLSFYPLFFFLPRNLSLLWLTRVSWVTGLVFLLSFSTLPLAFLYDAAHFPFCLSLYILITFELDHVANSAVLQWWDDQAQGRRLISSFVFRPHFASVLLIVMTGHLSVSITLLCSPAYKTVCVCMISLFG